jgi:hypothetical protein
MSDAYVSFKFKGKQYDITNRDVTNQRLRQLKQWFGRDYGSFTGFPNLLRTLDADAWACALWIGQQIEKEKVQDPREMDFSLDDFELLVADEEEDEPGERPTGTVEPDTTPVSTGTASKSSKRSTSSD